MSDVIPPVQSFQYSGITHAETGVATRAAAKSDACTCREDREEETLGSFRFLFFLLFLVFRSSKSRARSVSSAACCCVSWRFASRFASRFATPARSPSAMVTARVTERDNVLGRHTAVITSRQINLLMVVVVVVVTRSFTVWVCPATSVSTELPESCPCGQDLPMALQLCAELQKLPNPQRHHEGEPAHDDEPCKGAPSVYMPKPRQTRRRHPSARH